MVERSSWVAGLDRQQADLVDNVAAMEGWATPGGLCVRGAFESGDLREMPSVRRARRHFVMFGRDPTCARTRADVGYEVADIALSTPSCMMVGGTCWRQGCYARHKEESFVIEVPETRSGVCLALSASNEQLKAREQG